MSSQFKLWQLCELFNGKEPLQIVVVRDNCPSAPYNISNAENILNGTDYEEYRFSEVKKIVPNIFFTTVYITDIPSEIIVKKKGK